MTKHLANNQASKRKALLDLTIPDNRSNKQPLHSSSPDKLAVFTPLAIKPITLVLKSKSADPKSTMEKFKDFSRLRNQIKNCFDDIKIQSCFIDRSYNLVIKLENEQQKASILSKLALDTTRKFFDEGLEQIVKIPKYFFAIHNVDTSIDLDTYTDVLANKYKITELTRMTKKSSNEPFRTIKAATSDLKTYNEIINEGRIKIYYSSLKVSKWNFTENADQCFKCLIFGHHSSNCHYKPTAITNVSTVRASTQHAANRVK
jgi:hypothetical protein